jgi:pyruvate-formate lyase-activating enzyme
MGEPLLHPRLPEFLDICESYGHRVNLVTNGTLLAKLEGPLMAKPALRRLSVSLHSLPESIAEENLHEYLQAIKECASQAANREACIVQLRLWNKKPTDSPFHSALLAKIREAFGIDFSIEERLANLRSFMLGKNLCID